MSAVAAAPTQAALAHALDEAQRSATPTEQLPATEQIGLDAAYAVQHAIIARRQSRGERIAGVKLGFTSLAKARQMGVDDIIIGTITDAMRAPDGGRFDRSACIHPRIEPEVAYLLGADLDGEDPSDERALAAAIAGVAPALEIIDSRYRDFRFTYGDVVADNTSAAAYVVGPWRPVQSVSNRAVRLSAGTTVVTGSTAAILGDPVRALHALLDMCRRRNIPLRAGQVVLAGAATAAVPLTPGVTSCDVAGIGAVSVRGVR